MFEHPLFLLGLFLIPVVVWRMFSTRERNSIPLSSVGSLAQLPRSWRVKLAWIPEALMLCGVCLAIIALARPRMGREQVVIDSEGIAMEIVVDKSGSMQAMDFQIDGTSVDRLTAIKSVASDFITGDLDELNDDFGKNSLFGRASDLIGLISFAGYADAVTPPTLDHTFLLAQLENTRIVNQRSEDGTAIGDAISLAIEKLGSLDQTRKSKVTSKVIILMTDGENTAGEFDPLAAAELAKTMGVKVYTIGVGTKGRAPFPTRHPFTGERTMQWMQVNIDETTLKKIANLTGGEYFRATNTNSLKAIYEAIDSMEKTKIESHRFTDYREFAIQSFSAMGIRFPPIALMSLYSLSLSILLKHLVIRSVL